MWERAGLTQAPIWQRVIQSPVLMPALICGCSASGGKRENCQKPAGLNWQKRQRRLIWRRGASAAKRSGKTKVADRQL